MTRAATAPEPVVLPALEGPLADLALAHTDPDVRTAGKEIVEDFLQD